jgi:hypothetical protein
MESAKKFNEDHALAQAIHTISGLVWLLGVAALGASFLPLTLPFVGKLPLSLGINSRVDNIIIQGGLLLLFFNTTNVYNYYVSYLECPHLGSFACLSVYVAHLGAVWISFFRPSYWLGTVAGILALRGLVNLQLYCSLRKMDGHPWLPLFHGWLKRSLLDFSLIVVYAVLVQRLSGSRFYSWLHGLPLQGVNTPLGQAFLSDIHTLLNLFAFYPIATHAVQQVRMRPSFTKDEIETQHDALNKFFSKSDHSKST